MILVGGGYIAAEFAGIFHGLGVKVTQLYRGTLFLRGFDDDVRAQLAQAMRKRGVDLRFNADVKAIERSGAGVRASLNDGTELSAGMIMYATGRAPNTRGIGLDKPGSNSTPRARSWSTATAAPLNPISTRSVIAPTA